MFTQEELLEAVDILVEDYGYDEEEAIDMVNEAYEAELDELSEAVDILMEDYGYDEEEAIDMLVESYEDDFEDDEDGLVSEAGRRHLGFASKSETLAQKARKGIKRGRRRLAKASTARKRKIARKAQMKKMDKRIKRAKKAMHLDGGRKRRRR